MRYYFFILFLLFFSCNHQEEKLGDYFEENPFVVNLNIDCLKRNGYKESWEINEGIPYAYCKYGKDSVLYAYFYSEDSATANRQIFARYVYKDFYSLNFQQECRKFVELNGGEIYDFNQRIEEQDGKNYYFQRFKVRGKYGDIFDCELVPTWDYNYVFTANIIFN